MQDDFGDLTGEALSLRLVRAVWEANLLAQGAVLEGQTVQMDVVEKSAHGVSFPQYIIRVGEFGVPPLEPRAEEPVKAVGRAARSTEAMRRLVALRGQCQEVNRKNGKRCLNPVHPSGGTACARHLRVIRRESARDGLPGSSPEAGG